MATFKHTYLGWEKGSGGSRIKQKVEIAKKTIPSTIPFLSIDLNTNFPADWDVNVGDEVDIIYDFTIPKSYWDTDDDGTTAPDEKFLNYLIVYISTIKVNNSAKHILISRPNIPTADDIIDAFADPTKAVRIHVSKLKLNTPGSQLYVSDSAVEVTFIDSPSKVVINGKLVKAISFGGTEINDLTIDGHKYEFSKDITITEDEVKEHIKAHTTWVSPTAELIISSSDYTSSSKSSTYANQIVLTGYTWPPTVETKNSLIITFNSDVVGMLSDNGHIWFASDESETSSNAVKIMCFDFPITTFKAGETWLFSDSEVPKLVVPGTTATIADAKLKGLDVTYSKQTGITDGEAIDATVKFDASVGSLLNGGTVDVTFSGIVVANPDRTITEQEVDDYADANIQWPAVGLPVGTIYITDSDYTTVTSQQFGFAFTGLTKSIPDDKNPLVVTFKSDITWAENTYTRVEPNGPGGVHIDFDYNYPDTYQADFKAGETWLFEETKFPVLYVPPVTSANLDITKWPALHPGTKLYTPDLHMVDGKEITLTVQADHGYTVNGGASVDYKYIPSNTPTYTYNIAADDFTSWSVWSWNHLILSDWAGFTPSSSGLKDGETIAITFPTGGTISTQATDFTISGTSLVHPFTTSSNVDTDIPISVGDTVVFEYSKSAVKVS